MGRSVNDTTQRFVTFFSFQTVISDTIFQKKGIGICSGTPEAKYFRSTTGFELSNL